MSTPNLPNFAIPQFRAETQVEADLRLQLAAARAEALEWQRTSTQLVDRSRLLAAEQYAQIEALAGFAGLVLTEAGWHNGMLDDLSPERLSDIARQCGLVKDAPVAGMLRVTALGARAFAAAGDRQRAQPV